MFGGSTPVGRPEALDSPGNAPGAPPDVEDGGGAPPLLPELNGGKLLPVPGFAARPAEAPKPTEPKVPASIKPSKPGEVRYRDRRLIALLFDFSSMPQPDQIRAQAAAQKFLNTQMSPSDVVSILSFSNSLKVEQDFTDDRDQLARVIKSFKIGEGSSLAAEADTADTDSGEDTQAAFTADETEFNIFNTDRKLSALESAAKQA